MLKPMRAALAAVVLLQGCLQAPDLEGRQCPCVDGYRCDLSTNRCVRDSDEVPVRITDGSAPDAITGAPDAQVDALPPSDADSPTVDTSVAPEDASPRRDTAVPEDASALDVGIDAAEPDSGPTCVATQGDDCDNGQWEDVAGCDNNYGCADFWGIYYRSPMGCDSGSADSFVEHDGPTCTYVGFSASDPFNGTADGTCINSTERGYSIPDTHTRVVPGTGCTHREWMEDPGTIQCDGSCQ